MSHTVCILYGLNEGPAMGKQLTATLERAGLRSTRDPTAADIIFAHSGGCYLIPARHKASVVVLCGLPYWPGRPLAICLAVKVWREWRLYHKQKRLKQWVRKWTHHLHYALDIAVGWRMATRQDIRSPWNSTERQVIVRNRYDCTSSPLMLNASFNGPRAFISLPGEHDDCWDNPEPYVNLIQSLLKEKE